MDEKTSDTGNKSPYGPDPGQSVESEDIEGKAPGYLARPGDGGKYPGIVMIHEWWGLNDHIKRTARILADKGYVVFAVDLFGGEVATEPSKAMELATMVRSNPDEAVKKMKAAVQYLRGLDDVGKIGSIGWCFGGGQSLQLSLNEKIDATVIYYGNLVSDKDMLKKFKGPVLGIFGSTDTNVTVSSVEEFRKILDSLGIRNSIHVYDGVGHAFANPTGNTYAEKETADAWKKTLEFFAGNLRQAP